MSKATRDPQNLSQIVTKPRWTPEDAAEVVAAWRRSGQSQRAFCERHAIDGQRLARWAKLSPIPEPRAFAEVVVISELARSRVPIIVELGSARVVVDHDVEDDHLARVLRIVGSVC